MPRDRVSLGRHGMARHAQGKAAHNYPLSLAWQPSGDHAHGQTQVAEPPMWPISSKGRRATRQHTTITHMHG